VTPPPSPTSNDILSRPTSVLLNDFGAGKASPGSGSASALMGLLAIELVKTVCKKTIEKNDVPEQNKINIDKIATFRFIKEQIDVLKIKLTNLFEKDALEFDQIVKLRLSAKASANPTDKASITRKANVLLETATNNILEISTACLTVTDYAITSFQEGWGAVRGDSGAAISSASAGATAAIFIINLNLKTLENRTYAVETLERSNEMLNTLRRKQSTIFACLADINTEATEALEQNLQLRFEI
jgi:methenyltetrahydrofolate cyclohydrolase